MRRLLRDFIACVRERPYSYKIALCRQTGEISECDTERLRALHDTTEYMLGRVVITEAIRRHSLPVRPELLRHITDTGTRYLLKNILLALPGQPSLRTLVRVAKSPLCQDDPLMRFLLIQAARAMDFNPNNLEIYVNTEQAEFGDDEVRTWRLWRPIDELICAINDSTQMDTDTLRLSLFENDRSMAEELARDLSDVFHIGPDEIRMLTQRRLSALLSRYIDLTYLMCQALVDGNYGPFEARLREEDRILPPGVLFHSDETPTARRSPSDSDLSGEAGLSRGQFPELEGMYPEESMIDPSASGETPTLNDLTFDPAWVKWIPRGLAEELLIIPLAVEGDPPRRMHIGCALHDHSAIAARLGVLGCEMSFTDLPEGLVREAIQTFYPG
ncbi:hypothetical protein JXA47_09410 [Candidatus Sumerlaeota bacterium]|nr:hypothetical protein [Candidatus Sumerlaeota bacterium]